MFYFWDWDIPRYVAAAPTAAPMPRYRHFLGFLSTTMRVSEVATMTGIFCAGFAATGGFFLGCAPTPAYSHESAGGGSPREKSLAVMPPSRFFAMFNPRLGCLLRPTSRWPSTSW